MRGLLPIPLACKVPSPFAREGDPMDFRHCCADATGRNLLVVYITLCQAASIEFRQ